MFKIACIAATMFSSMNAIEIKLQTPIDFDEELLAQTSVQRLYADLIAEKETKYSH